MKHLTDEFKEKIEKIISEHNPYNDWGMLLAIGELLPDGELYSKEEAEWIYKQVRNASRRS